MKHIGDIFELFGEREVQIGNLAKSIGEIPDTVRRWRIRGQIPSRHWPAVIKAANSRGEKISADLLMRLLHGSPSRNRRPKRKPAALAS